MHQKGFTPIIIIFVVLLIAVGGYYYWKINAKVSTANNVNPSPSVSNVIFKISTRPNVVVNGSPRRGDIIPESILLELPTKSIDGADITGDYFISEDSNYIVYSTLLRNGVGINLQEYWLYDRTGKQSIDLSKIILQSEVYKKSGEPTDHVFLDFDNSWAGKNPAFMTTDGSGGLSAYWIYVIDSKSVVYQKK